MDRASQDDTWLSSRADGTGPHPGTHVRLFANDFLERLTRTSVQALVAVWVPLFSLALAAGLWMGRYSLLQSLVIVAAGALSWTLLEYLAHRFFFHLDRWLPWARPLTFLFHGCHHVDPQDATRNVMPLLTTIPLFAAILALLLLTFDRALALSLVGSAGLMYVAYDVTHYGCHQWQPRGRIGRYLKARHLFHHFRDDRANFGVSSPLWDWVFGTLSQR
jgi:sterol desaturase/sphingolipid hydroxylase (fatty acid hydroxylase superfamily)